MPALKALLFDYGGTLDANGIHWLDRIYPFYQSAGISVAREEFDRAFYQADDHLAEQHDLSQLDLEQTLTLQVQDVLKFLGKEKSVASSIVSSFVENSRQYLKKSKKLLERLRSQYRLAIVSNFYGNLSTILKKEGLLSLFEVVADSTEVGATKPDPRIFHHVLSKLNLAPHQALMVGDSLERDMRGAEASGIHHAWLYGDRFQQTPPSPCCSNFHVLKSLEGVVALCSQELSRPVTAKDSRASAKTR